MDNTVHQSYDHLQQFIPENHRIERVHKISPKDFIEKYYLPKKPVVLTGLASEWPAFSKWSWDYLEQIIGERSHTFHYEDKNSIKLLVKDYIKLGKKYMEVFQQNKSEKGNNGNVGTGNSIDLKALGFPEIPSQFETIPYLRHFGPLSSAGNKLLSSDLNTTCMFPTNLQFETTDYLFIGLPGTKTEIHYDGTHNFVSMIKGQKHIALLPPGDYPTMFEGATKSQLQIWKDKTVFPMRDPENLILDLGEISLEKNKNSEIKSIQMHQHPNLSRIPELLYSPIYAGEIVFFPAYWFHYIHNVDLSLSITTQSFQLM